MPGEPDIDVARIARDLELPDEAARVDLSRIAPTWRAPEAFAAALRAAAEQTTGPLASRPGASVALYFDAVLRHRDRRTPAVVWYAQERGWSALGYADLDAQASSLAATWRGAGVKPGALVALALAPGPTFVVACLATLRLGALVSVLSPEGSLVLERGLEALAPAHVVVDPRDPAPLPAPWRARVLPVDVAARANPLPPATYAAAAPVAKLLSPLRGDGVPVEVSAQQALVAALRDAALTLRLSPGRRLAAPLVDARQHFPALLLACLVAGATFVTAPDDALRRNPSLLDEQPLDTVLLCDDARALLEPVTLRGAERWSLLLRGVEEPLDWERANAFVKKQRLQKTASSNVLVDAAAGGALLASAMRPGSSSARALPVPGQPWSLRGLGKGAREPASGAGLFVPVVDKRPLAPPAHLLAPVGSEYLFGGTLDARRKGRVYPTREVLDVTEATPGSEAAGVVALPQQPGHARFVLCVFTGTGDLSPDALAKLRARLAASVGPRAAPDAVEVFAGYPHRLRSKPPHKLDAAWLSSQYLSGLLHEKARDERYVALRTLASALGPA